jgi:hypothetical protein
MCVCVVVVVENMGEDTFILVPSFPSPLSLSHANQHIDGFQLALKTPIEHLSKAQRLASLDEDRLVSDYIVQRVR